MAAPLPSAAGGVPEPVIELVTVTDCELGGRPASRSLAVLACPADARVRLQIGDVVLGGLSRKEALRLTWALLKACDVVARSAR